jgi:all-trans-retinol dehydrogenase (NAD+)
VIHSAGVVSGRPFLECSDEQLERTMAVNTLGMFWIYKAFLPEMVQRGEGHLVTIASAAGMVGVPKLADYCASKWAAIGFDEAMRNELRGIAPGVRTTIVCPYYVDTGMFEGVKTRFRWLLPILKGEDVAARVLRAIERNRARVWMPWFVYTAPLLRFLLPVRLFDATGHFLGITRSMEDFVGRASPEERGR